MHHQRPARYLAQAALGAGGQSVGVRFDARRQKDAGMPVTASQLVQVGDAGAAALSHFGPFALAGCSEKLGHRHKQKY